MQLPARTCLCVFVCVCSHDEKIEVNDFVPPFHSGVVVIAVFAAAFAVSNRHSRSGKHEALRVPAKRSAKNPSPK